MQRKLTLLTPLVLITYFISVFYSCQNKEIDAVIPSQITDTTFIQKSTLSEYNLFKGALADLTPADNVEIYELNTPLFTDYSEKQRLIKLPAGTKLTAKGDSLPVFPEGTIIAKTFYYYNDLTDLSQGKRIIETRLLIKHNSTWRYATYQWNSTQTDAILVADVTPPVSITWKQTNGVSRTIQYHIPTKIECTNCHTTSNKISPIGPKLRNLNRTVVKNGSSINQLEYLLNNLLINNFDISSITHLPDWSDSTNYTLEERARAYFDVNCSHCHNQEGMAAITNLYLSYEIPFNNTGITDKDITIINRTSTTGVMKMPKIGTTILHDEGVKLIKKYIESL